MAERCENCRFWAKGTDETVVGVLYRQCRRTPPVLSILSTESADIDFGTWPLSPSGAWCGEFKNLAGHHG